MRKLFILPFFILLFAGCQDLGTQRLGEVFKMPFNAVTSIENTDLSISFIAIKDSRCPVNSVCIDEGSAIVTLFLSEGKKNETAVIEMAANAKSAEFVYNDYVITLLEVAPYPKTQQQLKPKKYSIKLRVDLAKSELVGVDWQLTEIIEGDAIHLVEANISAKFTEEGLVGGELLCHGWGSSYEVKGNTIDIEAPITLAVMCPEELAGPEYDAVKANQAVLFEKIIPDVESFDIQGQKLVLSTAGEPMYSNKLVFELADPELARLKANRALWNSMGVKDYSYSFSEVCFCVNPVSTIGVVVRNNRVTAAKDELGNPVPTDNIKTMAEWFDFVEATIKRDPHNLTVEYHESLGVPTNISIDYHENIADDEYHYTISNMRIPKI